MTLVGKIFWWLLGGLLIALVYFFIGLELCLTIIGIPFGLKLLKLGCFVLNPFGRELVNKPGQPGVLAVIMDILWILIGAWEVALLHLVFGLFFFVTIVGYRWGKMHFRLAKDAIFPFGKEIRNIDKEPETIEQ